MARMLERVMHKEILSMAADYPVVTVIGPRQSGKTTLVRSCFPEKVYISLENIDERQFALADPKSFLEKLPQGAILDEIQRAPELLSYMQGIVDSQELKGMFILTGSHQFSLHKSITQSLAGRTAILKLLPLSMKELSHGGLTYSVEEYLLNGMYPRIYKDNLNPTKTYRDYVQTYIERDVREIIHVKDISLFQNFLKLCAGRIGQIFNSSAISNDLGIAHTTVREWLSILEASFIITRLPPYYENLGKRVIKSPKLYFNDIGLACYLLGISTKEQILRDPLKGNLFENLVVSELIKNCLNQGLEPNIYFYRDSNQNEVDLIYKSGHHLVPIEIKSSQTFHTSFLNALNYLQKLAPDRVENGYLIYAGNLEQKVHDFKVINYKDTHKMLDDIINISSE